MPETARALGLKSICDPTANIDAGVRHLRRLLNAFPNPLLAAAAYNAGEGAVLEHGGIPRFRETLRFVAREVDYQLGIVPGHRDATRMWAASAAAGEDEVVRSDEPDGFVFVNGVMQF